MSIIEEETELRDLVAQTLETNGVLGKIKAQLRASVFLALDEAEQKTDPPLVNKDLKSFISTNDGKLVIALITECLNFFHLNYTLSVFQPESYMNADQLESRISLAKSLGIKDSDDVKKFPLLVQLLRNTKCVDPDETKGTNNNKPRPSISETIPITELIEAKKKFNEYDVDKSGFVDKNELRQLFVDFFPNAERNMLERYLNDEFKSADKDFSSDLNFEEFLSIYKRLFDLFSKNKTNEKIQRNSLSEVSEKDNFLKSDPAQSSPHATDVSDDDTFSEDKNKKSSNDKKKENISDKYDKIFTTSTNSLHGLNAKSQIKEVDNDVVEDLENEENYDEDFQESNISPLSATPRQEAKLSNGQEMKKVEQGDADASISEDINEDIEANSEVDDITSDRTMGQSEISGAFDYIEDAVKH